MPERRFNPSLVNRTLAHYRVLTQLGKGGMGEVYLAEDLRLRRRVALKVLSPSVATEPRSLERFQREARSVAALNHPNIVTLHSVEEAEGLHFLVLEHVEGETLSSLISEGPMQPEGLLPIALQLAEALEAAHARGIIHRDLKPWNVMVTPEGRVKVLDFGIAKLNRPRKQTPDDDEETDVELTRPGRAVRTVAYMSPEQAEVRRTALLRRGGARERQQSLEVSLELSLESPRMSDESRRLFSILGLLPEGLARGDLPSLLPEHGPEAASILRKVGLAFDQGSRLRMLAPIREHARQNHPPPPEDLTRTIDHHLNVARLGEKVGTEGGADAVRRLRPESGNLDPMILAGLERTDPVPAIHSALSHAEIVRFTGLGGLSILQKARQAAQLAGEMALEADCLRKRGGIELYRGQLDLVEHEDAERLLQQARQRFYRIGQVLGQANCAVSLGKVAEARSDPAAARVWYEEALALFREIPKPDSIGRACMHLAALSPPGSPERLDFIEAARQAWEKGGLLDQLYGELDAVTRARS